MTHSPKDNDELREFMQSIGFEKYEHFWALKHGDPELTVAMSLKAARIIHEHFVYSISTHVMRARISELELLDTRRHHGKDYQESLDELDEYKQKRLAHLNSQRKEEE